MSGKLPSSIRDGRHYYTLRVYFEDTDAGGIVYHGRYLGFAERARTETLRDLGVPHAELVRDCGLIFVVRRAKLDYLRPARLDDVLEVATEGVALAGASVTLRQTFRRLGEAPPLAVIELLLATVRLGDHRPARLPARWREGFARLVGSGGARAGKGE
ncbi:MAG: YbgC/FadM family acyl-CoA thioesterase [Alphaproteobacteria bacterium]|nr:YbgC/FadM family acyl-CoA thioesterase [Alphaproteobacteria bacterium]